MLSPPRIGRFPFGAFVTPPPLVHLRGVDGQEGAALYSVEARDVAAVFAAACGLYLLTLCPGPFWGDSAALASHLDTTPTPFARSYWLYKGGARVLTGLGFSPALAVNLTSAAWAAVAVALTDAVVQRVTGDRLAAVLAAGSLAVAHTMWSFAVVGEVYTLLVAWQLALVLLVLGAPSRRREAILLGVLGGLALNHHRLLLASLPALALYLVLASARIDRRAVLGRAAAGFAVGAVPFAVLCLLHPPSSLPVPEGVDAWTRWWQKAALGGAWSADQIGDGSGKPLLENLGYVARFVLLDFPSPALALAALGAWSCRDGPQRKLGALLGALGGVYVLTGLRFGWAGDQFSFLLPLYPVVAIAAGLGLARLKRRTRRRSGVVASVVAPPLLYALLAFTTLGAPLLERSPPQERAQILWPGKTGFDLPETWCRARLAELPPGAILVSQWGEGTVFRYLQQTETLRTDVQLRLHRDGPLPIDRREMEVWVTWSPYATEPPESLRALDLELEGEAPGFRRLRRLPTGRRP